MRAKRRVLASPIRKAYKENWSLAISRYAVQRW